MQTRAEKWLADVDNVGLVFEVIDDVDFMSDIVRIENGRFATPKSL